MRILLIISLLSVSLYLFPQTICIDPGHGYGPDGEDVDGRTEEEITTNCAVGLLLRDSLESHGYTVIMTREDNEAGSWMSLTQRAELADEYESERLLSIHCNGGGGTGTETFWCYRNSPNTAIDETFSSLVQNNMSLYGEWRSRRSIEDFDYLGFHLGVLKGTAPGCLNEIGFVDTPDDLVKLLDEEWRKVFAYAYRIAIDETFLVDYPSSIIQNDISFFQVYPMPFKDDLYIHIRNNEVNLNSIELVNLMGQTLSLKAVSDNFLDKIHLDTENILPGIYILRLNTTESSFSKVILK